MIENTSWSPLIVAKRTLRSYVSQLYAGSSGSAAALGLRVATLMPSMERMRFVSSGTEAAMSAIRVARAATGREKIVKFEGCYHGHADAFLVKAGSGALTLGVPTSPGVPRAVA